MSIKVVLYGGTGSLIGRALVLLMMTNPLKKLPDGQEQKMECVIRDYDTEGTEGNTDYSQLNTVIQAYTRLHNLGMKCIASSSITITAGNLKSVRNNAYHIDDNTAKDMQFSINELFCGTDENIRKMFLSCLTNEQVTAGNQDGCFGDLARNAYIAEGMVGGFNYDALSSDDKVFYIGSTDGGTANTVLDVDALALLERQTIKNSRRPYKIYSIRTLPYKKFSRASDNPTVKADAERIYQDMIAQSSGVLKNMLKKISADIPAYAAPIDKDGAEDPDYLFDSVILTGYNVDSKDKLDDTNVNSTKAQTKQQFHYSHGTELVSALAAIDVLNNEVKPNGNVYGYSVEIPDDVSKITATDLFSSYSIDGISLEQKIMKFAKLYAVVKLHMYPVFSDPDNLFRPYLQLARRMEEPNVTFIKTMYHLRVGGDGTYEPDEMKNIAENVFKPFLENAKYFLEFIQQVQQHTQFATGTEVISIFPKEQLKNLLENDANKLIYSDKELCTVSSRGGGVPYSNLAARLNEHREMRTFRNDAIRAETDSQRQSIAVGRKLLDIIYNCI